MGLFENKIDNNYILLGARHYIKQYECICVYIYTYIHLIYMYSMYTTLWSGYHYYSKFIDKEMRNREIKWLSQGYTVYQLGVSREIQQKDLF